MKIGLEINEFASASVVFAVRVENDGLESVEFSLEHLSRSISVIALDVSDRAGGKLVPVEYRVVNYSTPPKFELLGPGEVRALEVEGRIEEKLEGVFALILPNATYRLVAGGEYFFCVVWCGARSEQVVLTL